MRLNIEEIIVLISSTLITLIILFLMDWILSKLINWLFNDDSCAFSSESELNQKIEISNNNCNQYKDVETTCNNNCNQYKDIKTTSNPEVFNVKDHLYKYGDAINVCRKYNSRLATKDELIDAQKNGANWCNLGWLMGQDAYYPTQKQQVDISNKWPDEFRNGCGSEGINGGFYPIDLKLGVNCFGIKPLDLFSINPWNTLTQKWSKYS